MKVALILPEVVSHPMGGGRMRLLQLQEVMTRVFEGRAVAWDLVRDEAFDLTRPTPLARVCLAHDSTPTSPNRKRTIANLVALGLYAWPWFVVRRLEAGQRIRILNWLDAQHPTHVVLTLQNPYAIDLIPELRRRGLRVVVDCQNVESDLARQVAALSGVDGRRLDSILNQKTIARWERLYLPVVDQVWLPSLDDLNRQRRISSDRARLFCVPNALDLSRYPLCKRDREPEPSADIVLPGAFNYRPNIPAAQLLRDRVLPIVQQAVPHARLLLVGRDDRGWARELAREPDVVATGMVANTQPYLQQAGVIAVPILHGSGTRYKILEALALGRPVVTTPLGCEGLDVRDGVHLLIREVDRFAEAIIEVLRHPARGLELALAGRSLVEREYSWEASERIVRRALDRLNSEAGQK